MKNIPCPKCKSVLKYSQENNFTHLYVCPVCMGSWAIVSTQEDKHRALIEDIEAKKKIFKEGKLPSRYKCPKCDHICTEAEMEADACGKTVSDEFWSNWICPNCKTWYQLEDWEKLKE